MAEHGAGTCHFCGVAQTADETPAEFNETYGVLYDGCERGYGILRVWSLNGVRWGGRPSERCACTRAQTSHG